MVGSIGRQSVDWGRHSQDGAESEGLKERKIGDVRESGAVHAVVHHGEVEWWYQQQLLPRCRGRRLALRQ